ncbi:MAG: M1 family metallopeptidase, partial [candidate division Zixibacteria bacterium]|nr:M1 family metallopeptidase [candidate division Zixibacteria bacterium]
MKPQNIYIPQVILIFVFLTGALPAHDTPPLYPGYWQQKVDYEINVTLDNDGRTISGSETIHYKNNSPDTLRVLYLKAFANSARKGSLMDHSKRDLGDYALMRSDSSKWGYSIISNVRDESGAQLDATLDDTNYEIVLNKPIAPNDSATLRLQFETRLPEGVGDRHEFTHGQTKAAYWYPQVCVYDRKMGWVNAPYLGRGECYGDFGNYDVKITASEDRIVVATGILANRNEVLPDSLRELLDIKNFFGSESTWPELNFDTARTKTWRFYAAKVNDFAWVAGKDFCIDEGTNSGIKLEIYAKRSKAKSWKKALQYAGESVETFSELYGAYAWPVVKVTDSYDGMEYPMITFCSGGAPSAHFPLLIYHEIGHFWFMGLVGTNQVDRACLDEGFTTMAEIVAMEKYLGREGNNQHFTNWYQKKFYPKDEDRDARGYRIYLEWVRSGYDHPMIISSDNANEYWAYRNSSYYKPVVMHFSLRSIFGDSLYFAAMRRYGETWFFKHPYEDDFIRTFSANVGENLDEYFAQWFTSRRQIDYAYKRHRRIEDDRYEVTLSKPGDFVSPVDVAVISKAGDTMFYTVNPEGHGFVKPGYIRTSTWRQYRQPSRSYKFEITASTKIRKIVVDPYNLLPDVNRMNNESGTGPIDSQVDAIFYDVTSMHAYSLRWRPDLWYDRPNGLIAGWHTHGSYVNTDHKFNLDFGIGTESALLQVDFKISHPFRALGRLANVEGRFLRSDKRTYANFGFTKEIKKRWTGSNRLRLEVKANYLNVDGATLVAEGFISEGIWSGAPNSWLSFNTSFHRTNHLFRMSAFGRVNVGFRFTRKSHSNFLQGETGTEILTRLTSNHQFRIAGRLFFSELRDASFRNEEFMFHLTRSQPYRVFTDSRIFRSPGSFPTKWSDDFYLDGVGVRGYQNRSLYGWQGRSFAVSLRDSQLTQKLGFGGIPWVGSFISGTIVEIFYNSGWIHLDG